MANKVEKVNDIIKVTKGGIEFYGDAHGKVEQNFVKQVFTKMIQEKQRAITELQPFAIAENGEKESNTAWAVDIRNAYTNILNIFTSDDDHTYINQLEEVEDKVLEVLDDALEEKQPAEFDTVLRSIRARMQSNHDEMKALQKATA